MHLYLHIEGGSHLSMKMTRHDERRVCKPYLYFAYAWFVSVIHVQHA